MKTVTKIALFCLVGVLLLALTSCDIKDTTEETSVVGTYRRFDHGTEYTYTLRQDGKCWADRHSCCENGGTWVLDGETVIMTFKHGNGGNDAQSETNNTTKAQINTGFSHNYTESESAEIVTGGLIIKGIFYEKLYRRE